MLSDNVQQELWSLEAKILAINALPPHEQTAEIKQLSVELQSKYRQAVRKLDNINQIEHVGMVTFADLDARGLVPRKR